MNNDEEFFNAIYHLSLVNRINFFLFIWDNGEYQSTLQNKMKLSANNSPTKESLEKYAEEVKKFGFLTIVKRTNPNTQQRENFYLVSDENFKNIFLHLCKTAHIPFDIEKFNLVFNDRKNVKYEMIDNILERLKNDKLLNEDKLITLLNKNLSFFFLFIMKFSSTMNKHDDELFHFYNEVTVRLSVPTGTLVSRNVWDLINIDP